MGHEERVVVPSRSGSGGASVGRSLGGGGEGPLFRRETRFLHKATKTKRLGSAPVEESVNESIGGGASTSP